MWSMSEPALIVIPPTLRTRSQRIAGPANRHERVPVRAGVCSVAIKPVVVSAPATSPCGLVLPENPSLTTLYTPALGKHRYSDTRPAPAILEVSFFGPCPPLCLQRKVCRGERVLASPIEWARRGEGDRKRSFETRWLSEQAKTRAHRERTCRREVNLRPCRWRQRHHTAAVNRRPEARRWKANSRCNNSPVGPRDPLSGRQDVKLLDTRYGWSLKFHSQPSRSSFAPTKRVRAMVTRVQILLDIITGIRCREASVCFYSV